MTDAHCHVRSGDGRHFLCAATMGDWDRVAEASAPDIRFYGVHPWEALAPEAPDPVAVASALRERLAADAVAGVGEIGLDRLREREIGPAMRELFRVQLEVAAEFGRPVALHGAKCWGETVKAAEPYAGRIPAFIFHGFSRSGGLLPRMVAMGGYVTVGAAALNDHAVNYRELVKEIPLDRLLVESDRTAENAEAIPPIGAIAAKVAEIRGMTESELVETVEANAERIWQWSSGTIVRWGQQQ